MMGRTHALTGWCAGLALAPAIGATTIHQATVFAAATAGFALLPDLDHPNARASRLLGPATAALSWLLRRASAATYQLTKGPRDERRPGTHRHLTHTVAFAAVLGILTAAGTKAGGPWAVAGITVLALLLAEAALGDWLLAISGGAIIWWIGSTPHGLAELAPLGGWLGIAVTTGCITHCLGDAITESGCPLLWPIPIKGETWYELRPPSFLRITTGKTAENWLIAPAFTLLALLLLPGALDAVSEAIDAYENTSANGP